MAENKLQSTSWLFSLQVIRLQKSLFVKQQLFFFNLRLDQPDTLVLEYAPHNHNKNMKYNPLFHPQTLS